MVRGCDATRAFSRGLNNNCGYDVDCTLQCRSHIVSLAGCRAEAYCGSDEEGWRISVGCLAVDQGDVISCSLVGSWNE